MKTTKNLYEDINNVVSLDEGVKKLLKIKGAPAGQKAHPSPSSATPRPSKAIPKPSKAHPGSSKAFPSGQRAWAKPRRTQTAGYDPELDHEDAMIEMIVDRVLQRVDINTPDEIIEKIVHRTMEKFLEN